MERRTKSCAMSLVGMLLLSSLGVSAAWSAVVLYTQPAYESPVRADPDDLLLIPGYGLSGGDKVIYEAVSNTTQIPTHPALPSENTADIGLLDLVSSADAPYALVEHLPVVMTAGQSYAIWVYSPEGAWSAPILINDARPLWITPDSGYQTASLANLQRMLKVVGRNLEPGPGTSATTFVRLVGQNTGTTYTLAAKNSSNDASTTVALERYVAAVNLPFPMTVDQYAVQVSRDGTSWVSLLGNGQSDAQTFVVKDDPPQQTLFPVASYPDPGTGQHCIANDPNQTDATGCILEAIRAATVAGGGTVVFDPGTWYMSRPGTWSSGVYSDRLGTPRSCSPSPPETCGVTWFGILVPAGVSLQGAGATGANATVLIRGSSWYINGSPPGSMPSFTLLGGNSISGIDFVDQNVYSQSSTLTAQTLQLGLPWYWAHFYSTNDPYSVSNVTITGNLFDKPWVAIGNRGLPMDHIYITNNTFGGAYTTAVGLGQDPNEAVELGPNPTTPYQTYHFNDSVIDYNTFYPSSLNNVPANGTLATGLNTGLREDFSNNIADGTSTQYLYNPGSDPTGWRAGYFWTPGADTEMALVSSNYVSCSGDKSGDDGEAFAYDGSFTAGGLPSAEPVISSASWTDSQGVAGTAVTLQGTLVTALQIGTPTDISSNPTPYYRGFWAQVVAGAGKGQWRKVESVTLGGNSAGSTVTLYVTPAFDVIPDATSQLTLDHAYWQTLTVNNVVEQRKPPCTKANSLDKGGVIIVYHSTADSAIEGNQQYNTNGVAVAHVYQPGPPLSTQSPAGLQVNSSIEVRNNLIQGEYDWANPTPSPNSSLLNGIQLSYGAAVVTCQNSNCAQVTSGPPPDIGFAVSIAGNTIAKAQGRDARGTGYPPVGAIGMGGGWDTGPADSANLNQWELGDSTLVFHNTLRNISDTVQGSVSGMPEIGIGVDDSQGTIYGSPPTAPVAWRTVAYANACNTVDVPMIDLGTSTVRYCPAAGSTACECVGVATVDVGVSATSSSATVNVGGSNTYTVTVTNNSSLSAASGVVVALTPSAGVELGTSLTPSQGSCDPSVDLCNLGALSAGRSATVTVSASFTATGTQPVTFSVTHHEADNVPMNDSVTVNVTVQ